MFYLDKSNVKMFTLHVPPPHQIIVSITPSLIRCKSVLYFITFLHLQNENKQVLNGSYIKDQLLRQVPTTIYQDEKKRQKTKHGAI